MWVVGGFPTQTTYQNHLPEPPTLMVVGGFVWVETTYRKPPTHDGGFLLVGPPTENHLQKSEPPTKTDPAG